MKTRFSTIDVTAAVHDLRSMQGFRIMNVYDINHKTYIMKLSFGPDKFFILFESGIRIHRAYHHYEKSPFPSSFSIKLRKHLNNRRLTRITQLGMDRIVDMQIDEGDRCVHVIVELYDKGNIVLTDSSYTILNVLRPRTDKNKDVKFSVNQIYPVPPKRELPELPTVKQVTDLLHVCDQKAPLKRAIAIPGIFSGALIEHALRLENMPPDIQVGHIGRKDLCAKGVVSALDTATRIAYEVRSGRCYGFVPYATQRRLDGSEVEALLEYNPCLFIQHEGGTYHSFTTFSEGVDAYYAVLDAQKQQQAALKIEKEAMKRLENVRKDQYRRILELEYSREEKMLMADLIIHNKALVDSAIQVICRALAQKTSWEDVERMHLEAIHKGDYVARAIVKLDLKNNRIFMRLREELEGMSPKDVPISINMNAFGNACKLYHGMKAAAEKALRTGVAAEKAIKTAEEKANTTIKKAGLRASLVRARKEMWFEKFIWFISSERYMVITGRDATQNELLVKKYLRKNDVYVHADAHGAASVVIRNKHGGGDIPPKTLTEAAQMAVCCTKAWGSQISSSSWWVYAWQVSKVAKSGEYLTKGSFVIRGKKNFLPSCPLVLGFGILFRVDEITAQKHKKEMEAQKSDPCITEASEELHERSYGQYDNILPLVNPIAKTKELMEEHEYPDIRLDVPMVRLQYESDYAEDYSVIDFATKFRPKKQKVPTKEQETKEYLEKKAEEERKAAMPKKIGKRQKHKMEKIRKKYRDQDDEEREMRMALLGCRGKPKAEEQQATANVKQNKGPGKNAQGHAGKNDKSDVPKPGKEGSPLNSNQGAAVSSEIESKAVEETIPSNVDEHPGKDDECQPGSLNDKVAWSEEMEKHLANLNNFPVPESEPAEPNFGVGSGFNGDINSGDMPEELVSFGDTPPGFAPELFTYVDPTVDQHQLNTTHTYNSYNFPSGKNFNRQTVQRAVENDDDDREAKITSTDEGTEALMSELLSNPEPDDVLLYAVPMVGPYQVFQNFKYKVKLTPGSSKKGKAGKMAVDLFLRMKDIPQCERELIRALAVEDKSWTNIPTGCRVSAPQLHAKK
ncbi:hypothetical protein Y032_0015g2800 [Ancylostoma ceylanicum]|uniref:NFACT RNA-binding domain-containing protein n=1 Tax=Ancylostoma ceylanicum TaxID=53326 RepID=A0A016V9N3_9BILA|nr:hypothetical protein Y032_0015g2800 [Ancylostoma ceylanicum]